VNAPPLEVDEKISRLERAHFRVAAAATKRRADAREQLVDPERLGDVVVGPRIERLDLGAPRL
jgi:hypothetical protein